MSVFPLSPLYNHTPAIYKIWAGPVFFGPKLKIKENVCGSAHTKTIKIKSESKIKSPFKVRVKLGENGRTIEFQDKKKDIDIPEGCFHIYISAKSYGTGQILRCEIY